MSSAPFLCKLSSRATSKGVLVSIAPFLCKLSSRATSKGVLVSCVPFLCKLSSRVTLKGVLVSSAPFLRLGLKQLQKVWSISALMRGFKTQIRYSRGVESFISANHFSILGHGK